MARRINSRLDDDDWDDDDDGEGDPHSSLVLRTAHRQSRRLARHRSNHSRYLFADWG
jgi:hypothetical protein